MRLTWKHCYTHKRDHYCIAKKLSKKHTTKGQGRYFKHSKQVSSTAQDQLHLCPRDVRLWAPAALTLTGNSRTPMGGRSVRSQTSFSNILDCTPSYVSTTHAQTAPKTQVPGNTHYGRDTYCQITPSARGGQWPFRLTELGVICPLVHSIAVMGADKHQ